MEEKKVLKKWIVCILIAVISNWAINHLSFIFGIFSKLINIFLPFIIGGILAFMLNIPMTKIEKNFRNKIKGKNSKITIRILI